MKALRAALERVNDSYWADRSEEQMEVMRRLWTERSVRFEGRHHLIEGAGLAPLPVQRPIPIWIGAAQKRAWTVWSAVRLTLLTSPSAWTSFTAAA